MVYVPMKMASYAVQSQVVWSNSITGTLNRDYFCEEMVNDIMDFLKENLPSCRNIYLPYHMDFVTIESSEEYNGEY